MCNKASVIRYYYIPVSGMCLTSTHIIDYTISNTAATPLDNAQPWWLFYARDIQVAYA